MIEIHRLSRSKIYKVKMKQVTNLFRAAELNVVIIIIILCIIRLTELPCIILSCKFYTTKMY